MWPRRVSSLGTHQRLLYEIVQAAGRIDAGTLHERYEQPAPTPRGESTRRTYLQSLERYELIESHDCGRGTEYAVWPAGDERWRSGSKILQSSQVRSEQSSWRASRATSHMKRRRRLSTSKNTGSDSIRATLAITDPRVAAGGELSYSLAVISPGGSLIFTRSPVYSLVRNSAIIMTTQSESCFVFLS